MSVDGNYNYNGNSPNGEQPGQSAATISMVLGIVGLVCALAVNGLVGMVLGIIGLIYASKAKNEGYEGTNRTVGFALSLATVLLGAVMLVACVACVGTVGILSLL